MVKISKGNEKYKKHGWKVHNGQRKAAEALEPYVEGAKVTPWKLRDDLARKDKKGRVYMGGRAKTKFELAESLARIFKKRIIWSTIGEGGKPPHVPARFQGHHDSGNRLRCKTSFLCYVY